MAMIYGYVLIKKWDLGTRSMDSLRALSRSLAPVIGLVQPVQSFLVESLAVVVVLGLDSSSGCELTIRLARYRFMVFVESGEHYRLGFLLAGNMGLQELSQPIIQRHWLVSSMEEVRPLLKAQAIGSLIVVTATFPVSLIVMNLIKAIGMLRVSEEGRVVWA